MNLQPATGTARLVVLALAAITLAAASGCGDGSEGGDDQSASDQTAVPAAADAASFPKPSHRSLRELIQKMAQGPALAPAVSVLEPGRNRFGFGLFDRGNRQIGDLDVALYYARGIDQTARGPFPARFEQIDIKPAFESKTTSQDPDAAKSVYVAEPRFVAPGSYLVTAVSRVAGKLIATSPSQVKVSDDSRVPSLGDRAISVHTPTSDDVGGKLEEIDTRIPPDGMHEVDLADALEQGRPIILQFATPKLCQSRVCGPVVDVAEQVHREVGNKVDFIHMEVYRDNDLNKGPNRQMAAWHLRSEPFLFAIDRRGRVVERIEGAFSVAELQAAVRRALR